ncbi:MAG: RidA family protein [Gemmatimonadales bacterium]
MDIVATGRAPAALGPYSQAIIANGMVFSAGQIALHPQTMEIVGEDIESQTHQVFRNLAAVLEAAGSDLQRVIRTTVFLADMDEFSAMNAVYAEHFGDHKPARSTVAVKALPKGVRVEIDLIAMQ